jgi:hypothetical protein
MKDTSTKLAKLRGHSCESVSAVEYEEPATETIYSTGTSVRFGDGTKVEAQFWRLMKQRKPLVSIPLATELSQWSAEALARLEPEMARAREWVREVGDPSFESVVRRFGGTQRPRQDVGGVDRDDS